jgi:hypothetical protein
LYGADFPLSLSEGGNLPTTMLSILAIILILALLLKIVRQPTQPPKRILTTLRCEKCNFKSIREFKKGDYIPKKEGKCQSCEGDLYIEAIYVEEPPRKKPKLNF